MEHRQHGKQRWVDHALCQSKCANKEHLQRHALPHYQYRTQRHSTQIPLALHIQTSVRLDPHGNPQSSPSGCNLIGKSSNPRKRPNHHSHKNTNRRVPSNPNQSHNSNRPSSRHQSIHHKGHNTTRIPEVCKGIQRRRIETIPTKKSMGPCHRTQRRVPGCR